MTTQDTSALLVVDMQNDFLARGGYYVEKAARVYTAGGELSAADHEALGQVYLHPPATCEISGRYQQFVRTVTEVAAAALNSGMTTIFVQASYDPEARYRPPLFLRDPQRRHYACHSGTWGADLVEPIKQLASHPRARIVEKHTFDAFFETELRGLLRFKHIDTVYIAGVETNVCVLFTACSALSNGFNTVVLVECATTSQIDVHEQTLQIIEMAQGRLMSTQEFLTLLER